jgi:hypothetical protein
MRAPDYVEPTLGWRVWDVVELDGRLRLRSPAFLTVWSPRRELIALCRRSLPALSWGGLGDHAAPHARCSCGIYAAKQPAQATSYLTHCFPRRGGVLHRVIGRVSLWDLVVECQRGWRAGRAYPASLYVPSARKRRLPSLFHLTRPLVPAEEIALSLTDYGVPVELIDCRTTRELLAQLQPPGVASVGESAAGPS